MPESTGKATLTNEEKISQRIENSIRNDGIASDTAERFLYNERVKIPLLRLHMLTMISSAEESYAQVYFDILAYLEERAREKKLAPNEIGDLSQSYFRTVKSLSDNGYPVEELRAFLKDKLKETGGEYPKPCELGGLCVSFQKEQMRSYEESREAALHVKAQMDEALEKLGTIQSALDKQGGSMERDHGVTQDMAEEMLKMLTALENTIGLQTESIREASEEIHGNGQKLEECETAVKEGREQTYGMLLRLEEKLESPETQHQDTHFAYHIPWKESSIWKGPGRLAAFFKRAPGLRHAGKEKKKADAFPGDAGVKGLILLLKEHSCPGAVRDKVQDALSAGVPVEEICLAVRDAYEDHAGEAEEMLNDVLDILILYKNQTEGVDQDE